MSQPEEDESINDQLVLIQLRELLDEGKSKDAELLFSEAQTKGIVARSFWDIVPIVSSKINEKEKKFNRDIFDVCEESLLAIAKNCNPGECLLLILEQAKDVEDVETYRSLLKPLRECLLRSGIDKGIDWCIGMIKNFTKLLEQPENKKPNDEEASKAEDSLEEALITDYERICWFLEPVISASALRETRETKTRSYTLSALLFLFGHPFCYLNSPKMSSLCEASLSKMSLLTGDLLKFHGIIRDRSLKRRREIAESEEEEEEDILDTEANLFIREENVSDLAYANYYYYLLTSEEGKKNVPQIYNPQYLMHSCLYLSNILLKQPEYVLISKGLTIARSILEKIDKYSIGHEVLELSVYHDQFSSLAQLMIYCDADKLRKTALTLFQNYIDRFNLRARYLILLNLYETANHSGFISLLTNITKASIIYCLDHNIDDFFGQKLERLIKRICRLPNGSGSDLVAISDEVVTALNLLRFLIIRDKDNSTGIWKMIDDLKKNYLEQLKEGLNWSRNHWKLNVMDLEKQIKNIQSSEKNVDREENSTTEQEITITVGGENLPPMPATEKIKFCRQALNGLDIIESILVRVNECVEDNSLRNH